MAENHETVSNLHQLLHLDAHRITNAEIQLKNKLPGWIQIASALKLKTVLEKYLDFVYLHVEKLESFFVEEQISSLSIANKVIQAYIEETEEKLLHCGGTSVKDACLLSSVQEINHYKISGYGTAAAFANVLGMEKAEALFRDAEINEKHIDDRLSQLAQHEININAKNTMVLPG